MAGLAGWIVAAYYGNVSAAMATMLGLKALVAAVIGGIGSVPGAFLGGILVGLIEAAWSGYFDAGVRDIVVYAILIVVLVLRPGGFSGSPVAGRAKCEGRWPWYRICRYREGARDNRGCRAAHADAAGAEALGADGRRGLRQIRESAGHELLQGARRRQQARLALRRPERACGVIAMSAGNHAQAVAYHAARLGIPATIVMPVSTPFVKVRATRGCGAEVVLDGEIHQRCASARRRNRARAAT